MPGELAPRRTLVKIDMCSDLVGMSVSSRLVGMVGMAVVGMAGFEPAASCSQSRRANQAAPHPADRSVAYRPGCYRLVRPSSPTPNARGRYVNG